MQGGKVLLVGVLPGPSQPKLSMNSYLTPVVEELRQGWENHFIVTSPEHMKVTICIALSCIACDIPDNCKVSGLFGHTASLVKCA